MDTTTFDKVFDAQLERVRSVLVKKAGEYADGDDDRLQNFRRAAHLQNITMPEALGGMMAKHTVSVYDLIDTDEVDPHPLELWDEKITDHINYLILLRAVLSEIKKEEV